MALYTDFNFPGGGRVGDYANNYPSFIQNGEVGVASGTRAPRPGDAAIWNSADSQFNVGSDANRANHIGVFAFEENLVSTAISASNDDTVVQYVDGSQASVVQRGFVYLLVNTGSDALNPFDRLQYKAPAAITDTSNWERVAKPASPTNAASTQAFGVYEYPALKVVYVGLESIEANQTGVVVAAQIDLEG